MSCSLNALWLCKGSRIVHFFVCVWKHRADTAKPGLESNVNNWMWGLQDWWRTPADYTMYFLNYKLKKLHIQEKNASFVVFILLAVAYYRHLVADTGIFWNIWISALIFNHFHKFRYIILYIYTSILYDYFKIYLIISRCVHNEITICSESPKRPYRFPPGAHLCFYGAIVW